MKDILIAILPYLDIEKIQTEPNYLITVIWVIVNQITFFSLWFILYKKLRNSSKSIINEISSNFKNIKENQFLKESWNLYESHFFDFKGKKKTEDFSEEYFNGSILDRLLNMRFWLSIPSTFIGFGILGTFVGLTLGISGFNLESSVDIQNSIKSLLSGIGTAFLTSLHGIGFSIIFGLIEKNHFNKFHKQINHLCIILNEEYKLTKSEKEKIESDKQEKIFTKWEKVVNQLKSDIQNNISSLFITKDENGKDLIIANLYRDILKESQKQSAALHSFSTDLAEVIIEKFEESTERKLVPEFKEIIKSLESLDTEIKSFSNETGKDIGKGVNKAVESLQLELKTVVNDFREAFSSGAMQQLNKVVESLDESAIVMENMPGLLKGMLDEIRDSNKKEMENRNKTISNELSSTIRKFSNSIDSIINNLEEAEKNQKKRSESLIKNISDETELSKQLVSDEINSIITSFKESYNVISSNLTQIENAQVNREKQLITTINDTLRNAVLQINDLIGTQENYQRNIEILLKTVTKTIESGSILSKKQYDNIELMEMISKDFKRVSQELNSGFTSLQESSSSLKEITSIFSRDFNKLSEFNKETFENMQQTYDKSIQTLSKLNHDYEMIQSELSNIFYEIEKGVNSFSQKTRQEINNTLMSFTKSLTEGTKSLAGSIEDLNEFFDEISEKLDR